MKVVHLLTEDGGGAGMAAGRLHRGLRELGVDSTMLVSRNIRQMDCVEELPPLGLFNRVRRRAEKHIYHDLELSKYASGMPSALEVFSSDRVFGFDRLSDTLPHADVYNLHWVAGLIDYKRFFGKLREGKPLVWRLPDMYPFTGGCHYAYDCTHYMSGCGQCPQLGSSQQNDPSSKSLARKKEAFAHLRPSTTCFVAPSRWTQKQAKNSSLLSNFPVKHIPNSVDCNIFKPSDRSEARRYFDLPSDELVILFVAVSITDHRKGFDLLQSALAELKGDQPITLASVGSSGDGLAGVENHRTLGQIDDEKVMALAYSAADIFVTPARAESFGQVVIEAMACGTPVVGFDVGGIPDMVRPGQTGLLAPPEDVAALSSAIQELLSDDQARSSMAEQCRRIAVEEYSMETQSLHYKSLYEDLVEGSIRIGNTKNE